ncbi:MULTISPECIES: hypothetical protein [unclassified Halobacteriovorax]|uniref:hypothetical protein n=1 Tax=unclassified Halobacteriovorax TaxID=2639665 RepID=UPI000EA2FD2D|nr:hypothetical protein [Halobacteriovorax sp. BALOs_7]
MIKKSISRTIAIVSLSLLVTSCANMNSQQKRELAEWEAEGIAVKEKDEVTAAVLNVLPGVGDFYNGNVGYGITNLLFWPASVLWAPFGGVAGAQEQNYYATKNYVSSLENNRRRLLDDLDTAFMTQEISKKTYYYGKNKIKKMKVTEFKNEIELRDIIPVKLQRLPASN